MFSLRSYSKFLSRNKLYTAINVIGFAISLSITVLFGLYIQDEMSVDQNQPNKNRIYRLRSESQAQFSAPIATELKTRYPDLGEVLRVTSQNGVRLTDGVREDTREDVLYVDSCFFDMFDFPFIEGSKDCSLKTRGEAVITRSYATNLFGNESPIGKKVVVDTRGEYVVTAMIEDLKGTHFKNPALILRFEEIAVAYNYPRVLTDIGICNFQIYVMTNTDNGLTQEKLNKIRDDFKGYFWLYEMGVEKELQAEPLTDVYYSDLVIAYHTNNDRDFLFIIGVIAISILVFAVFNYINLSVAQSGFRAKEAASRRLFGGSRFILFSGYVIESIIMCGVSMILALLLVQLTIGWFDGVMDSEIVFGSVATVQNISLIIGLVIFIGVVSGMIPALMLSKYKPIEVVRGTFKQKTKMVYSKVLITLQYLITIILLGCAITIIKQIDFMKNSDLGYNKDNILTMSYVMQDSQKSVGLRDELMKISGVKSVGFGQGNFIGNTNNNTFRLGDVNHSVTIFKFDTAYINMLELDVIKRTGIDSENAMWINEVTWNAMGLTDDKPYIKTYDQDSIGTPVSGVIRNLHFRDMRNSIGEMFIRPMKQGDAIWEIAVQISSDDPYAVADKVKAAYKDYNGKRSFRSQFLEEGVDRMYNSEKKMSTIMWALSAIAMIISTMGLLAMSIYSIRQRTKEIALRKVFGSTDSGVIGRLMKSFLQSIIVAFLVSIPAIMYLMSFWLQGYVYRTEISWWVFALAGAIVMLIAFVTMIYQAYRATCSNPIKSLKE